MNNYRDESIKKYLDDLAGKLPAPGGGSAAALAAALGISLVSMVINFTSGKPKYARYEKELKRSLEKSEELRERFSHLVDLDVLAYKSKNMRESLNIPLMTARLIHEAVKLCPRLIKIGNVNLISDIAVAAVLLEGAFASAFWNVRINLKIISDKKLSRLIQTELLRKEHLIKKVRLETEERIGKIIRG